jgi:hypothetical protein
VLPPRAALSARLDHTMNVPADRVATGSAVASLVLAIVIATR